MTQNELYREVVTTLKMNEAMGLDPWQDPTPYTQQKIKDVILAYEEVVQKILKENHNAEIPFGKTGKFATKEVGARSGVNTLNGVEHKWESPAHTELVFKVNRTRRDI